MAEPPHKKKKKVIHFEFLYRWLLDVPGFKGVAENRTSKVKYFRVGWPENFSFKSGTSIGVVLFKAEKTWLEDDLQLTVTNFVSKMSEIYVKIEPHLS